MSNNCAYCGKGFIRSHPAQRFCGKRKGRHICKDAFHNTRRALSGDVTPARRQFLAQPVGEGHFTRVSDSPHSFTHDDYLDTVHPFSEEAIQG